MILAWRVDGKTNSPPLERCRASARTATARSLNGTRCSTPAFIRLAGTVQVADSRSISPHVEPRASPDRAAVKIKNSRQSVVDDTPKARIRLMASPTWAWGRAAWCSVLPCPFRGRTAVAACAGSPERWPRAIAHRMTTLTRCKTRRAVSGLSVQIGAITPKTSPVVIASTGLSPRIGKAWIASDCRHSDSVLRPRQESR